MKKTKIKYDNKYYMVPTYMLKLVPLVIPAALFATLTFAYGVMFLLV